MAKSKKPYRKTPSPPASPTFVFPAREGVNFPGNLTGWEKAVHIKLPEKIVEAARERPLCASLLPTTLGYFPHASGHIHRREGGTREHIFIWCLSGEGWCKVGDRTVTICSGELLMIPANSPHSYGSASIDPWTIAWWHVVGDSIPDFFREFGLNGAGTVRVGLDLYALEIFQRISGNLEQGYTPMRLIQASLALADMIGVLLGCARITEQQSGGTPHYMARIARSIAYARENLTVPLSVADLANVANLSVPYFNTLFRRQTGFAPMDYFIRLRMHRACQLLDTTDQPVRQIAAEVGYSDPLYFSRAFRAIHDVAPREYRNRHKV